MPWQLKLPTTTRARVAADRRDLVLLLAVAGALSWRWLRPAQLPHFVEVGTGAYVLPKPDTLADFRLVKHDDTVFDNQSLKGRWTFLIFGYTFCPDFCPTTLVEFAQIHRQLAQRAQGTRDVQFVMVSVDPERDTPQLLGRYVPQFNREFVGVTGDPAVIKRLADSVGAVYAKVPGQQRQQLPDRPLDRGVADQSRRQAAGGVRRTARRQGHGAGLRKDARAVSAPARGIRPLRAVVRRLSPPQRLSVVGPARFSVFIRCVTSKALNTNSATTANTTARISGST